MHSTVVDVAITRRGLSDSCQLWSISALDNIHPLILNACCNYGLAMCTNYLSYLCGVHFMQVRGVLTLFLFPSGMFLLLVNDMNRVVGLNVKCPTSISPLI